MVTGGGLLGARRASRVAARQPAAVAGTLDDIVTAEALLVTYLGMARTLEEELGLDDELVRLVRAVQCEEDAHHNVFAAAGGIPAATSFTVAARLDNGPAAFLRTWQELEQIMVGLHMAATRAFAIAGDLRLVEIAFQAGAVEAQHLATLRRLRGEGLPTERAFAAWRYRSTGEAVAALADLGLMGEDGEAVAYPGPREPFCRGVVGLVPETTDDQPIETPGPRPEAATPVAGRRVAVAGGGPR